MITPFEVNLAADAGAGFISIGSSGNCFAQPIIKVDKVTTRASVLRRIFIISFLAVCAKHSGDIFRRVSGGDAQLTVYGVHCCNIVTEKMLGKSEVTHKFYVICELKRNNSCVVIHQCA